MTEENQAAFRPAGAMSDRDRLFELIRDRSFRQAPPGETFTLASGEKSDYFFDLKLTMLDPEGISLLASQILPIVVARGAHFVGGLAMGAVPIVVATVMRSHEAGYRLQGFWVRKEQKDHGTKAKADGYVVAGEDVVIVEDVTTKGGSAMQAVREARERGCTVSAVVTVVDREQGARDLLAGEGIELVALYTRSEFMRR